MTYTISAVDYIVTHGDDWPRLECTICHFWVSSPYSYAWADAHAVHH